MAKSKKNRREMRSNVPKVSVILTSYNHAAYISAAIESVLNQTFTDFELLIVDDGSRDNSREIIKNFNDPRIKFFLYEKNRGPVAAVDDALKSARGKYVAVHHSDDLWTLDKLSRQVEFLDEHNEFAACFTRVDFIDEHGEIQNLSEDDFYKSVFEEPNRPRAEWLQYFFHTGNCLCHPSAMLRREVYRKYQLLDVHGFWQLPDYLMWIRLCFHEEIYILPDRLTKFRLRRTRQENTSATTFDKLARADLEFYFIAREFVYNFTDNKFFLEVFPEAKKYVVNGQINRRFAFAKICLDKKIAAWQLAGLELLKELLNSPVNAAELKTYYDYDDKSFLIDGGSYDVFNLAQKFHMLNAQMFADSGNGFELTAEKIFSVDKDNKFYGRIDFELEKPAKMFRFDPSYEFISLAVRKVLINGAECEIFWDNSDETSGDFKRFFNNDPQLIFRTEKLSGHVTFEIFAELEPEITKITSETIKNLRETINRLQDSVNVLTAKNQNLESRNENLQERNHNLQAKNHVLDAKNRVLTERNRVLAEQNRSMTVQNKHLDAQLTESRHQNSTLSLQNANLAAENQRLGGLTDALLNSTSWKVTEPFRDIGQWLRYDNREKFLSATRLLYKIMPLDDEKKVELKDKFYTRFAPLLRNTHHYKVWQDAKLWAKKSAPRESIFMPIYEIPFDGEFSGQPGTIAIQIHIFYLDLLEEMVAYCSNMPYKFDALVSIVDEKAAEKVSAAFESISNVENVFVRVVPNRGRDVAPFIVGFGDLLPKYDFVAHIHSKKSLYTGEEQLNWRNYLFDALLGSPSRIGKIFKAFMSDAFIGVIYPRPADNVPYAAFTWLSNREIGRQLLSRAKIEPNVTDYFDFPAGTMFWARTRALSKILDAKLTFEDFPAEQGQNDGTIAHAFERSVLLAARSETMSYYEFDPATEKYAINLGGKNLWQYFARNDEEARTLVVPRAEILSFDVFDTLIMRYVAKPYHVNEIIRLRVEDLLGRDIDFPTLRVQAEEFARQKKSGDVNLDDIYDMFGELTGLDAQTCREIRELEVSTEVSLTLPRETVVNWFREGLKIGKKVWLISDMYMQTPDLERLLQKCGVTGYEKLFISCETGLRKDTAAIWNKLIEENLNSPDKMFHIGDNEMSDVQLPGDRTFGVYHIMSAINLLSQFPFGRNLLEKLGEMSLFAGIFLGIVLAKKFQDPFELFNERTGGSGRLIIKSFRELGYWFYGTPILTFMLWLIQKTRADGVKKILFLARDGYFLQPLYEFVTQRLKIETLPSEYFYSSRRAVTVASIHDISDAKALMKLRFRGTTTKFFIERFGLALGDETEIFLPDDSVLFENHSEELVEKIIDENSDKILAHAAAERENFKRYIEKFGNLDNVGVVDMGYSGTIQFYLQKLAEKDFTGYYFATSAANRFGNDAEKYLRGCFTENDDYQYTKSAVYQYQLLFESILTAPDAQLLNFDDEGKPIFGIPEPGQTYFDEISEVHAGIKDFCRDVTEIFGDILMRVPIDEKFVDSWVRAFVSDRKIISPELRKIYTLDDEYCNTFHGNALELYFSGADRIGDTP